MKNKLFSIIIPIYYNAENIPYTIPRLRKLQDKIQNYDMELIFVDDGSGDNSLELLLRAREMDSHIKVVKLSKNFGAMSAIQAGLTIAAGDCVGVIAADLQDPPELFIEMIHEWEEGKKTVLAVRQGREESYSQKFFSGMYYFFMDRFAIEGYPKGGFDFFLIDRQVVNEVNQIQEKNTNLDSLIFWLGHPSVCLPYVRKKRKFGKSRWTLRKKIKLFIDSFVSFSYVPIRFMSVCGFVFAFIGFLYGVNVIYNRMVNSITVEGWSAIVVILTFGLGMIMLMLGFIGEYLWRILDESRKRPAYIIDEIYN